MFGTSLEMFSSGRSAEHVLQLTAWSPSLSAKGEHLALLRPPWCSLEQQPAVGSLTFHVSARPVSGCREAQRCSLKLMKHQHTSLTPPPGH